METAGALQKGMLAMNKAMMRPDNAAAAGDEYSSGSREAGDAEADMASTDEVMVDLVQRNIAVMEGKYVGSNSASSSTASSSAGGAAGDAAEQRSSDTGSSAVTASTASSKKKKSSGGRDVRREQSLGHLSAVFVQMFLANDTRVVSLEEAARWLLRSSLLQPADATQQQQQQQQAGSDEQKASSLGSSSAAPQPVPPLPADAGGKSRDRGASLFKSKVRRLYDIANVLSSLKLIEKIQLIQSRRPAFRWLGANVYPLHSTIHDDAYTREGSNKSNSKADSAAKRRTPSKQDSSTGGVRVKQESVSAEGGGSDANGALSQTLHSAFSSPGSLAAVRTQPLSFSFTKPPSIITPSGPSLSQLPGSAHTASSSSSALTANSSSPSPPSTHATSTLLPATTSFSLASSSGKSSDSRTNGGAVYWIVNHDRSFSMDINKMAEFEPLDFAYLPYICPPGLHNILHKPEPQPHQPTEDQSSDPSAAELPLPPHVAELAPAVQASYVRDTAGFVSAFSAACQRWMRLIPHMAQLQTDSQTNGSANAAPHKAATAAARSGSTTSTSDPAPPTRSRRSNTRNNGSSRTR